MLNKELLVDFAKLTEQAGYSVETMTALGKITQSTGGDLSDNTAEILGTAKAFNAVNKLALNEKDIVAEVAKTGAATVLTFGRSADALAKNVMQAKQFGLNLQQAEAISSSLLNFQSSIESEMEAELLTGKQLNLEQARMLALQGKTGEAAAEVAKQFGTAEEFGKMLVPQQEALAKSVGMTREDLAKSLIEREALVKLSGVEGKTAQERFNNLVKEVGLEEAKKRLGDETLANQLAGQSVQERFTASIEKLKEVFVSLAEPLMPVLDLFAQIAEIIAPIAGFIGQILKWTIQLSKPLLYIFGIYKGIKAIQSANIAISRISAIIEAGKLKTLQGQVRARGEENAISKISILMAQTKLFFTNAEYRATVLTNTQKAIGNTITRIGNAFKKGGLIYDIGSAAVNAIAATMKFLGKFLGPFAIPAAIAAGGVIAAAGYKFLKGNDVVSKGYGKRTLMAPEGAIQLNDKDTVIAGTDLGGGTQQSSGGGSVNMAPLVAELQAIKTLLNTVLTKEGTISINGATVATAIYPDIQRMSRLKDFKTQ